MISRKGLVILCIIGVTWVVLSYFTQRAGYNVIVCPSRLVYDLPCAGCGGTRAFLLLIKGHPVDAFFMNPNVYPAVLGILAALLLAGYDFVHHTNRLRDISARFRQWGNRPAVYVPVLLFEAVVWGYNIWRYRHGML
ncbi:MAG: DUF2752 domain-containing protein [Prevotella sp.]|nr:DUF2752 domain-containing protein [Prevotella sp.]